MAAETALALLGETGSPAEIPHLLEFVVVENVELAGAASWALGRIIRRHTEESRASIRSIAAEFNGAERLAVAEQILRNPGLDPAGDLLDSLSEIPETLQAEERDAFFPALLSTMAAVRGREGVNQGRRALAQQSNKLSRNIRRECNELLAALRDHTFPPVEMEPSSVTVYDICAGNAIWDDEEEEQEDDELDPVLEPVRRTVTPGRNEPCWCGSGKKYKKCHLDSDSAWTSPPQNKNAADLHGANEFNGLRKRIGEFLDQVLPSREMRRAAEELFGGREEPDKVGANMTLTDWMVHDRMSTSLGRTVMEEFLVRQGSRLTEREREMVQEWSRSFVGFYEVQELKAGTGLTVKDLIFDDTFFVHDVNMSRRLARWDGLLVRVVPGERGLEVSGTGLTVPRHSIEPLRQWMEDDRRNQGLEWLDYLKKNWPAMRQQSFELAENWMDSLRLANTDGEELLISKGVYRIIDKAAAMAALRNYPEFTDGDTSETLVWLNDQHTVMGNIRTAGNELTLECNSRKRFERGQRLLDEAAGKFLRHLRDEFTTQNELRRQAKSGARIPEQRDASIPKEMRDKAVAHMLEKHYREWPDTKLPALNGKTPREAVRTERGRKLVIGVLKDIENGEDRKRRAGEPFYDVAALHAELGLHR